MRRSRRIASNSPRSATPIRRSPPPRPGAEFRGRRRLSPGNRSADWRERRRGAPRLGPAWTRVQERADRDSYHLRALIAPQRRIVEYRSRPSAMPLRIGFDLDGVLADMEGELARRAETLFGDGAAGRLREGAAAAAAVSAADGPEAADSSTGPDPATDNAPPLIKLRLTPRQQRRLWSHVETIENFWVGLNEIEPGVI